MYENNSVHIWGPDTQAHPLDPENLSPAGRLIDQRDPALTEILQAFSSMAGQLGNLNEPDEDTVRMAIRLGRARYARIQEGAEPARGTSVRESVNGRVYYARRGAMVKIGTTVHLYRRMYELRPEEVLAIDPGSYAREAELHRLFEALRVPGQREWFYAGKQLQEHIEKIRDLHGQPPSDLPTLPSASGILEA
ncbi:GIY-YIG nuclease family protein [Streptomyces niveus]|uniref:GIY-YIG nuclease family protein n=1 Tax=Streptomyces niveus TaxID=193462 RepID=UPI0036353542